MHETNLLSMYRKIVDRENVSRAEADKAFELMEKQATLPKSTPKDIEQATKRFKELGLWKGDDTIINDYENKRIKEIVKQYINRSDFLIVYEKDASAVFLIENLDDVYCMEVTSNETRKTVNMEMSIDSFTLDEAHLVVMEIAHYNSYMYKKRSNIRIDFLTEGEYGLLGQIYVTTSLPYSIIFGVDSINLAKCRLMQTAADFMNRLSQIRKYNADIY